MAIFTSWSGFMTKGCTIEMLYSKMFSTAYTNTHHVVTTFKIDGKVQSMKN